jgi:hypothetical protein
MNATDKLMAWAQIGLSVLFVLGTFVILALYELGYAHISVDQQKSFDSDMNWLTGACLIIVYFWFSRQRTAGIPDNSQIVTQTHTLPDGTKTTIVSPISAPVTSVPILATSSSSTSQAEHLTTKTDVVSPNHPEPPKGI